MPNTETIKFDTVGPLDHVVDLGDTPKIITIAGREITLPYHGLLTIPQARALDYMTESERTDTFWLLGLNLGEIAAARTVEQLAKLVKFDDLDTRIDLDQRTKTIVVRSAMGQVLSGARIAPVEASLFNDNFVIVNPSSGEFEYLDVEKIPELYSAFERDEKDRLTRVGWERHHTTLHLGAGTSSPYIKLPSEELRKGAYLAASSLSMIGTAAYIEQGSAIYIITERAMAVHLASIFPRGSFQKLADVKTIGLRKDFADNLEHPFTIDDIQICRMEGDAVLRSLQNVLTGCSTGITNGLSPGERRLVNTARDVEHLWGKISPIYMKRVAEKLPIAA